MSEEVRDAVNEEVIGEVSEDVETQVILLHVLASTSPMAKAQSRRSYKKRE